MSLENVTRRGCGRCAAALATAPRPDHDAATWRHSQRRAARHDHERRTQRRARPSNESSARAELRCGRDRTAGDQRGCDQRFGTTSDSQGRRSNDRLEGRNTLTLTARHHDFCWHHDRRDSAADLGGDAGAGRHVMAFSYQASALPRAQDAPKADRLGRRLQQGPGRLAARPSTWPSAATAIKAI